MNNSDMEQESKDEEEPSKYKQRNRGKKRKRPASESSTDGDDVLPENTLETEKSLQASAIKNNLDEVSVKKILKKVVTNDHVLALVKMREEEEDSSAEEKLRPKLTRAKAKELMKVSPKSAPWNLELTPIKHIPVKTRPEVKALIAQELPDDEDDEEYEPTPDDVPSDDDHILESSSDIDSLPRTPATPGSQKKATPNVISDGPFKVPQQELPIAARRKLVLEEEATIALRTRSKLSLSATSIEHIESSFVPPDDLPMADVDSLWNDFLKDCLDPVSTARHEDDDETDPEYNVAADPDANEEDEESLENSLIKISKKELNDLVTELFAIMPESATEQLAENTTQQVTSENGPTEQINTHWEGKQEPLSDDESTAVATASTHAAQVSEARETRFSIGKNEPLDPDENGESTNELRAPKLESENRSAHTNESPADENEEDTGPPALLRDVLKVRKQPHVVVVLKDVQMSAEQLLLLQQQVRQHVQLAAGSFLQLFVHPQHWACAPSYKDMLLSLNKMVGVNPKSVVNVCNLKPAVELITSWETSVSQNTPENLAMVEFVQKESERVRRRTAQNSGVGGEFPEMFMKVVANSTVFLYPYLLPGMPFRPDSLTRRSSYLQSEDELLALGLEQFWQYVWSNPTLFPPPRSAPRQRWGLTATLQLICRHMLPWLSPKTLMTHVRNVRKANDKSNPIVKYLTTRTVKPVQHTLLPYNERLTLYEQPEHEVPRKWLRYLATTSRRFMKYLHKSKHGVESPRGVALDINVKENLNKAPLPIDFTKPIACNRLNVLPPKPEQPLINRIDVPIDNADNTSTKSQYVATNIFTVLNTSSGSFLVPVHVSTKTVDTNTKPICTPVEGDKDGSINKEERIDSDNAVQGTKSTERDSHTKANSNDKDPIEIIKEKTEDHCSCCVLLRMICRTRQTTIVEYFKHSNEPRKCDCKGRQYPRVTNRLRLLLNNYKIHSTCIFGELNKKIKLLKDPIEMISSDETVCDDSDDDLATATLFQLKVTTRTATIRDNRVKNRVHAVFSKFHPDYDNPLRLVEDLYKIFDVDLVDLYKEFIGFLTAEQADEIGLFKDYFIERCMEKLVRKVEELVFDKEKRCAILTHLNTKFCTNFFLENMTTCDVCTNLLSTMAGYPALAKYTFSMFPHRRTVRPKTQRNSEYSESEKELPKEPVNSHTSMDYEADDSSSTEDEAENNAVVNKVENAEKKESPVLKLKEEEIDLGILNISIQEPESSSDSNMSMLIMSEEESIKTEPPEWKREEDKLILEVIKQHVAPAERKEKTVHEIVEETPVVDVIRESLTHKSVDDVKERILYLLQLLVCDTK
ncbi:uncharacterized protein [Epargyreus clarus]|uniref:uncharacterized protein isoform X2 n=1 Tax=Epargyreus clarus TaxID=520877 RepID=UPI003C2F8F9C